MEALKDLRALVKFCGFVGLIAGFIFSTLPLLLLQFISPKWARSLAMEAISFYSALALKIFEIRIEKQGVLPRVQEGPFLFAGNHLSYLDILVLASQFKACFVTSYEVKETPFLGQLARLGGCLFVERRNRRKLPQEIASLTAALVHGHNIVLFPEATSTNGSAVLRFRRPLFQAALDARTAVLPFCLNYKTINSRPLSHRNRDLVFWYGAMSFLPHLWQFLRCSSTEVELRYLASIPYYSQPNTTSLAQASYHQVQSFFKPIQPKSGPAPDLGGSPCVLPN